MAKHLKLLAIDLGASSGRVILGIFDGKKITLEEMRRFSNTPAHVGYGIYWDILGLYNEIRQGFTETKLKGHRDIACIGIDTWGNDFGLFDKNGRLIDNPVHYRDERTIGMMDKVFKTVEKKEVFDQTGIQFMRFNGLYQLYSMVSSGQPVMDIADRFLMIPDILVYFMTGIMINEFTNATTTQMYNPLKGGWAVELLGKLNIPVTLFGEVIQPGTLVGRLSDENINEFGFSEAKVAAVAEHDTACAVVAVPTEEKDFVYISSGTWSLMGIELEEPLINEKTFTYNFTNEGGVFGTYRLLKNVMGLWIVQECKHFWDSIGEGSSFAELEEMAWKAKKFNAFIDPDYEEFGTPGDMPRKISQYCRQTGQNVPENKGEIIRCIMESLALKYRYVLEKIEEITKKTYSCIHIVGGGVKDRMLCSYTAEATGRKVIAGPVEATATGNMLMQLVALGEIESIYEARKIVRQSFQTQDYEPKDISQWNDAYGRFLKLLG